MGYEIDYDEDGRSETVYVKEEPDCYSCSDRGTITVDVNGARVEAWRDETEAGPTQQANCPECDPTPEQRAQQLADAAAWDVEFAAKVARGEASYDDESPF